MRKHIGHDLTRCIGGKIDLCLGEVPSLLLPLERGRALPTGDWRRQRSADERGGHRLANLCPHVSVPSELSPDHMRPAPWPSCQRQRQPKKRQEIKYPREGVVNLSEFASTGRLTRAQLCELQHKCRVVRH